MLRSTGETLSTDILGAPMFIVFYLQNLFTDKDVKLNTKKIVYLQIIYSLIYSPGNHNNVMVFPTVHIAAYEFHFNVRVYPLPDFAKKTVSK